MASTISAGTTTTTALSYSADTSGVLQLQTNGGTTAVTIDTAQNVGVGVTPSAWSSAFKAVQVRGTSISNATDTSIFSNNWFFNASNVDTYMTNGTAQTFSISGGVFQWRQAAYGTAGNAITFTQAMTLDASGNFIVGGTLANNNNSTSFGFNVANGNQYNNHINGTASGTGYIQFSYNGTVIGSITQSGTTAVNFNGNSVPPSDQRLKTNIVDAPTAQSYINNIKVRSFDWIADNTHQTYGMIAQELMTVAPEVVPVHADENTMMGIDYAKLVPALIKCVQELSAQVTTLQTQVTALKG